MSLKFVCKFKSFRECGGGGDRLLCKRSPPNKTTLAGKYPAVLKENSKNPLYFSGFRCIMYVLSISEHSGCIFMHDFVYKQ